MGGDGGAETAFAAMASALAADPSLTLLAVGPEAELERGSMRLPAEVAARLSLIAAETVLPNDMNAAAALRRGQGSSVWVALDLLAQGHADAVVSGGSTGALMALSRQMLGMLPGVERPALMAAIPSLVGPVWLLDLGANIQVDAPRLLEFAQLGHVAFQVVEKRAPRIGLLNIGSEPGKGPDVIREAARLIDAEAGLDYAGFVEADRVFAGEVDLVVCDGFAGNILLKSAEGAVRLLFRALSDELTGSLAGWLARPRLRRLHDRLDPSVHNGAPMLGVRGTVIKSHGSAHADGLAHALRLAALQARGDLVGRLERQLWSSY